MPCHTLNKYVSFHLSGLIHVISNSSLVWMPCHILGRLVAFCQCWIINVCANCSYVRMPCHILSRHVVFSPVWIKSCLFKFSENALSHFEQSWGLYPVWINSCLVKSAFSENALSHFEQVCGFSPQWINSCCFNFFCVWMTCYILNRHVAFCQCGKICFQMCLFCECLVTF